MKVSSISYARVQMSLLDILSGDFFNQYIKIGNIVMRSQGRATIDLVIQLVEGTLRIELDAPTYERCGLIGKPIASGNRKHIKSRYVIEYNLRLPSMVRGKKGFERLIYACKNVLDKPMTWLFADLSPSNAKDQMKEGPIKPFEPIWKPLFPQIKHLKNQRSPLFHRSNLPKKLDTDICRDPELMQELLEWIGMMSINSSRLQHDDNTNRYLCCYDLPTTVLLTPADSPRDDTQQEFEDVVHLRWQAMIPSSFVVSLFVLLRDTMRESAASSSPLPSWFTFTGRSLQGSAVTVCCPGTGTDERALDMLTWNMST